MVLRKTLTSITFLALMLLPACAPVGNDTVAPTIAVSEAYPYPSLLPPPQAATPFVGYPAVVDPAIPPDEKSPYPEPPVIPTAIPTNWRTALPSVTPTPTATLISQDRKVIEPECTLGEGFYHCSDPVLGIAFDYPASWGQIKGELWKGECGGEYYGFDFSENSEIETGGVSKDFCRPMGGNIFSLFSGFEPGKGCEKFRDAADCRQITDDLFIATIYPQYQVICSPGPGAILEPILIAGVSVPEGRSVSGFLFSMDFLSDSGKKQLFAPFGEPIFQSPNCSEPFTEAAYNQTVEILSKLVAEGTLDEETRLKVDQFNAFVNSITINP